MPRATADPDTGRLALLVVATGLAWAGFLTHNLADLPGQTPLSPESLLPTLVTLSCLALTLAPTTRTTGAHALLAWTSLNLVGGALSVLPLPGLPFAPEQSLRHYAFHALYALTQLPVIWWCLHRRRPPGPGPG